MPRGGGRVRGGYVLPFSSPPVQSQTPPNPPWPFSSPAFFFLMPLVEPPLPSAHCTGTFSSFGLPLDLT